MKPGSLSDMSTGYFCNSDEKKKFLDLDSRENKKGESTMPDVIHQQENGKWYWWDETWSVETGPFDTKELAQADLDAYCKEFLDPKEETPTPEVPKETITSDVEVAAEVEQILTDKEVATIMEKCFHHRIKMEGDNPQDWCHYRHNYCMLGNHAFLPGEGSAVADVCIRGY